MVQDNSLLEQTRHSEQLSLQQLQLAELQKIASSISSSIASRDSVSSISNQNPGSVGGVAMPTNMMAMPANQSVQGNNFDIASLASLGGLTVKSGVHNINNAAAVGKSALDRTVGYIEKMQTAPFFAYKSIDWTRTNMEQAEYIQMQSRHRLENASLKFANSLGNMGMASLGGAIGSAFGFPGAIAGTVVGSAIGSVGGDQILKHVGVQQGYEKWLQQNSGRFINMFESNDGLGDGFNEKENQKLSKILSKMNTEFFMSDDELFTMLNQVTDAGLMKSVSDMESFQKKFSGLVETVRKGAKMLNMSYEDIINLQGEWNKMGIKTDSEQAAMLSGVKTLSMITGKSETDSAQTLSALINNITSGTTLDAASVSGVAQADLALASIAREKNLYSKDMANFVENKYGSDDSKVAADMAASIKSGYGNNQIKTASLAAMKLDSSGNVVIDKDELNNIITALQNGSTTIDAVMSSGGQKLQSGELGANFVHQWQNMTGDQLYEMMLEGGGNIGANKFISSLINSAADKNPVLDANSLMVDMNMASDVNHAKMLNEWMALQENYGDAVTHDVQTQNGANLLRNDASSQFGVSLTHRIKHFGENIWQGVASWIPPLGGTADSIKDFWTDTDSALRNGYSSERKVSIADNEYRDVFKDIASNSDKLNKEYKIDIKKEMENSKSAGKFKQGVDNFFDILISPTRWDTFFSGGEISNTGLAHDGTSVKKLLKKVEKSKQMSEEEKRSMIANINQATGQTQDMVSGALEVVTALGGRGAREKMLDGITIDTATKVKTGASKFDDFTNKKVLSKLSLDDQQRIQELAVDHAVKQVEKQFGNNLNGLGELIQQKGYAEGNEKIQSILEGGVTKGEVKSLVKELMTVAQGGSGKSEVDKILGDVTENAAKNTKAANKNLDKANKNMEDMTNKLDEFTNTVNKAIKNLDKRTNQLETTMNRF